MTILSPQTLLNVLDLMADGCTVVETTAAIGGAPKSKIIFAWLADSETAGEFDPPPSSESPWCVTWRGKCEWFHICYREAVIDGREIRKARKSPLRAELEQRLAAKRAAPPAKVSHTSENAPGLLPRAVTDHVRVTPNVFDPPAPPPPRPSYAFRRAPPLDTVNANGPPSEGRFVMQTQRISQAERQAGKPEITEYGVRWH